MVPHTIHLNTFDCLQPVAARIGRVVIWTRVTCPINRMTSIPDPEGTGILLALWGVYGVCIGMGSKNVINRLSYIIQKMWLSLLTITINT